MHCEDPGCLKACPAPGAIVQYANGIVDFISENCIGCGYCVKGCPFDIPRISKVDHKSYKCTLCSDRVAVGLEPACVKACPTGAIMFGSKTDMTALGGRAHQGSQVARLRRMPGLYDPPGVERHACDVRAAPCRSAVALRRLAGQSKISAAGRDLEGLLKPLAVAGIALGALPAFLHWVIAGPNEVQPEDEEEAKHLLERASAKDYRRRNGRTGMTHPKGTLIRNSDRDPDQSLDHGRVLRAADAVGPIDVRPDAVLAFRLVRRRPMDSCDSSLDRHGAGRQLCRDDRAVLARQFLEQGRLAWTRAIGASLRNEEEGVPEVGRFNAGQKFVFWSMALLVPVAVLHRPRDLGLLFREPTRRSRRSGRGPDPSAGGYRGNHRLDHPRLRRDLGPRLDARDDAGLRDPRLGVAASPQVVAAPGGDRLRGSATRELHRSGAGRRAAAVRQGGAPPTGKWVGNPPGGVKAPEP